MDQMDGLSHAALGSGTSHQALISYCQYRVEVAATLHTQVGPGTVPALAGLRQENSQVGGPSQSKLNLEIKVAVYTCPSARLS